MNKGEKIINEVMDAPDPCLFVVDISVSRETAAAICDYIAVRGKMKIWGGGSEAIAEGLNGQDRKQMERYLEEGITRSTHVLGLISPENPEPWWLSRLAELGTATGVRLALLTLKGTSDEAASNGTFEILRGIRSLNEYLFRLSPEVDQIIFNNPEYGGLMAHTAPNHPLDAYLDWEK